jgi:RimJ/RimL family protein N-acetyltransferase
MQALAHEIRALLDDPARRLAMSRAASTLVDGWGAHRVAAWLCAESLALHARAATADDEALLLQWANDAATRAASFSSRPIAPEEHHRWLAARLADPDRHRLMMLCTAAGLPVGQVRFDHLQAKQWRINYAIEPDLRGRGLASRALQVAADALAVETAQNLELLGEVKADNPASRRAFDRLGFQASHAPDRHLVYSRAWPSA